MKQVFIPFSFILILFACEQKTKSPLENVLSNGSDEFQEILQNPSHEIQIIYGQIIEDSIVHYHYQVDPTSYFYPASTVKMPVAFAAVKKAEELGISLDDRLIIDSTGVYPRSLVYDSTFQDSIRLLTLIQKIFTVSDNAAYNILYGWMGKDYINDWLNSFGMNTRIVHQLGESAFSFDPTSNDFRRRSKVITSDLDTLIMDEKEQQFNAALDLKNQKKGVGFIDSLGSLIDSPFDFSAKNYISLEDLITTLELATRPDLTSGGFEYSKENQDALMAAMAMLPKNLPSPYDTLSDNYVKFFLFGNDSSTTIPKNFKIINKVGWAYGYLLDVAYIQDVENSVEFFLASVIHVNENQIYNDGVYEYESIGLPFLDELGDLIYEYEIKKEDK